MIIARYITKEILWTFLATLTVLLLIALSNRFALYLAKAATGELPLGLVFRVVGLYIPELLSYLIPLSFFIALLFAFGRLYADSEMTVLMACGISWKYICRLTLILALLIMFLVGALSLWWVPQITKSREKAISEGEAIGMLQSILPGRFQTAGEGEHVFYLEDVTDKHTLKGVFIAERPKLDSAAIDHGWTLITANEAFVKRDSKTKDFYLVLKQGYRYQGVPGIASYTVVKFDEYGRSTPPMVEAAPTQELRQKDTHDLMNATREDAAEFQWRLSLPLSVPILALLAIPLSRVRPRHGRYAKFLPAIVVYIIYYNLFTICKRWVSNGSLPSYLGVWWVHAFFLILGLVLIAKESGWINRASRASVK